MGNRFFSGGVETTRFERTKLPKIKASSVVLVANTRSTVIRVARLDEFSQKPKKLTMGDKWQLVLDNFPISSKMNENTHVFDGSIFTNKNGQTCFFMAALPINVGEELVKIGVGIFGSVHSISRIDTAEHLLFQKYLASGAEGNIDGALLVFLPQDEGLRVLHIENGLPIGAGYIGNNPMYREDELRRFIVGAKVQVGRAVLPDCENECDFDWLEDALPGYKVDTKKLK